MNLDILSDRDRGAYEAFLETRPEATFYHSVRYHDLLTRLQNSHAKYLVVRNAAEVTGVLPIMAAHGAYGAVLNSLPFFGSHGGVLAADADSARYLWREFADLVSRQTVAAATVIENPFHAAWPFPEELEPTFIDRRIGQFTRLDLTLGRRHELPDRVESSAYRNVRKAYASGVVVNIENDAVDFLEQCHLRNMREIGGSPKPHIFFELLPKVFRPGIDFRIYVARLADHTPVAALLLFYYKRFVEYFIPVTETGSRDLQPMAAILHRAICDAASWGYLIWNWGGTWASQTGVYRFKRKWGAEERGYTYRTYLRNPDVLNSSPSELSSSYRYFYVLPFDKLKAASPGGSS